MNVIEQFNNEVPDSIYFKYQKYIDQSNSNYLSGIQHNEVMEILRYCEKILGKTIPTNVSCSTCILDLVKLFGRLKNK